MYIYIYNILNSS